MRDIWTTENYKRNKAGEIAEKYGLDADLVEEALIEGGVFSDNMLVYYDSGYYMIIPLTEYVDLDELILDFLDDTISDIDNIERIIINGIQYKAKLSVLYKQISIK
jgi:hypothetical protein